MGTFSPSRCQIHSTRLSFDCPARLAQQRGELAIAIAAVLPSKLDNIGGQTLLIVTSARDLPLRRAVLPERRTGPTLGDMQLRSHCSMQARGRAGVRSFPGPPPGPLRTKIIAVIPAREASILLIRSTIFWTKEVHDLFVCASRDSSGLSSDK